MRRTTKTNNAMLAFLSGTVLTVHATESGAYTDPDDPSGYLHATFWVDGTGVVLKGPFGAENRTILKLTPRGLPILHASLQGTYTKPKTDLEVQRVRLVYQAACFLLGKGKLDKGIQLKASLPCQRPGCGRRLTAGQSLTLFEHPDYGRGFYGPVCAGRRTDLVRVTERKRIQSLTMEAMRDRINLNRIGGA